MGEPGGSDFPQPTRKDVGEQENVARQTDGRDKRVSRWKRLAAAGTALGALGGFLGGQVAPRIIDTSSPAGVSTVHKAEHAPQDERRIAISGDLKKLGLDPYESSILITDPREVTQSAQNAFA